MQFSLANLFKPLWERNRAGMNSYFVDNEDLFGADGSDLFIAQNHPILTPALMFVSKLFSQGEFWIENKKTGEKIFDHQLIRLLKKPNYYQTKMDFLETIQFMTVAQGSVVGYIKRPIGLDNDLEAIYALNVDLIEWPQDFKTPLRASNDGNPIQNKTIVYDRDGLNLKIKIKDLLFFYDMPNGMNKKNMFKNESRLKGLKQTLINTNDSLVAKNIILKTNGKELISGNKDGFPLDDDEKIEAEAMFNKGYGLSKRRSRALITKANVNWKSLHIALRDLGLDESVKVDGNIVYTALHIPKDILSLEAKKTTYNNFKESMVSYIQNEIQSSLDAFCEVMNQLISEPELVLRGSYDHMPVMQFILIEKFDGVKKRAEALRALLQVGIPQQDALEMVGLPRDMKLEPMVSETVNEEETGEEEEPKNKLKVM